MSINRKEITINDIIPIIEEKIKSTNSSPNKPNGLIYLQNKINEMVRKKIGIFPETLQLMHAFIQNYKPLTEIGHPFTHDHALSFLKNEMGNTKLDYCKPAEELLKELIKSQKIIYQDTLDYISSFIKNYPYWLGHRNKKEAIRLYISLEIALTLLEEEINNSLLEDREKLKSYFISYLVEEANKNKGQVSKIILAHMCEFIKQPNITKDIFHDFVGKRLGGHPDKGKFHTEENTKTLIDLWRKTFPLTWEKRYTPLNREICLAELREAINRTVDLKKIEEDYFEYYEYFEKCRKALVEIFIQPIEVNRIIPSPETLFLTYTFIEHHPLALCSFLAPLKSHELGFYLTRDSQRATTESFFTRYKEELEEKVGYVPINPKYQFKLNQNNQVISINQSNHTSDQNIPINPTLPLSVPLVNSLQVQQNPKENNTQKKKSTRKRKRNPENTKDKNKKAKTIEVQNNQLSYLSNSNYPNPGLFQPPYPLNNNQNYSTQVQQFEEQPQFNYVPEQQSLYFPRESFFPSFYHQDNPDQYFNYPQQYPINQNNQNNQFHQGSYSEENQNQQSIIFNGMTYYLPPPPPYKRNN